MNNLREVFRKYKAVVFFDVETTGLDAKTCRIIELAAIRIEQAGDGTLYTAGRTDMFVKLPEGQRIPEKITELTGITDEQLEADGVTEYDAAADFAFEFLTCGPVLLVAHNIQFDLSFTQEMLDRYGDDALQLLKDCDYLDSLTVYKDRRDYPHKLENAIAAYNLEGKVRNTHRAIDDVKALFEVCRAMDDERADLLEYVNTFGYNPKYGVSGQRIEKVSYWPQRFNKYMQPPGDTLPALMKKKEEISRDMANTKTERHPPQMRSRSAGYHARRRKPKTILHRFSLFFKRGKWKRALVLALTVLAGLAVLFLLHWLIFSSDGSDTTAAYTPEPPELTIEPEDKPQTYIFKDGDGHPVDWEHLTDAWAKEAGYEKRYPLTDDERLEIAQVITAEAAGEPFAGKVAVAQCILQTCEDEGIRPAEVLEKYKYSKRRPDPTAESLEAVEAVFDFGHVATSEPIRYFYAPELIESSWHESQVYVMTINNHKFFKDINR